MEVDFHSMSRKELQVECKKHNIRANLSNSEMANRLVSLLIKPVNKESKPKVNKRTCLKIPIETIEGNDSGVVTRQSKIVRFSSDNELIEYTQLRSGVKKKIIKVSRAKAKGKPVIIAPSVDEVAPTSFGLLAEGSAAVPVSSPPIGRKRGKKGARDDGGAQAKEDNTVASVRTTRSRAQTSAQGADSSPMFNPPIQKKRRKKDARDDGGQQMSEDDIISANVRTTRSRGQASAEGVADILILNPLVGKKRDDGDIQANDTNMVANVRTTRARAQALEEVAAASPIWSQPIEKKRGRKGARDHDGHQTNDGDMVVPVRTTRLRAQAVKEANAAIPMLSRPVEKGHGKRVSTDVDGAQSNEHLIVTSVRATRSTAQTSAESAASILMVNPPVEKKQAKRASKDGNIVHSNEDLMVSTFRATRSRAQTSQDGVSAVPILYPVEKKQAKGVSKDGVVRLNEELTFANVRSTRSRPQSSAGDATAIPILNPPTKKKQAKGVSKDGSHFLLNEGVIPSGIRATSSSAQTSVEGTTAIQILNPPVEKKGAKIVSKDGASVKTNEDLMVTTVRVTRSGSQTSDIGVVLVPNKPVDEKRTRVTAKDANLSIDIKESPVRVTRSRMQKTEVGISITVPNPPAKKVRGEKGMNVADRSVKAVAPVLDLSHSGAAFEQTSKLLTRRSLRNRDEERYKIEEHIISPRSQKQKLAEGIGDVSEHKFVDVDGDITQSGETSMRSRRIGVKVDDAKFSGACKAETVIKGKIANLRRSVMLENSGNEVKSQDGLEVISQLEEPANHTPKEQNKWESSKLACDRSTIIKENEMDKVPNVSPSLSRSEGHISTPYSNANTVDNKKTSENVGINKAGQKSSKLFMMNYGSQDKEHVGRSSRIALRNEGTPFTDPATTIAGKGASRKRKEQASETLCTSPVEETPRRFTRSSNTNNRKERFNLSRNAVEQKQKQSIKQMFEVGLSGEDTLTVKGSRSVDVRLSVPEIAKDNTALVSSSSSKFIDDNACRKRRKSGGSLGTEQDGSHKVHAGSSNREDSRVQLPVISEEPPSSKLESSQLDDRGDENEIHVSKPKRYSAPAAGRSLQRAIGCASKSERIKLGSSPEIKQDGSEEVHAKTSSREGSRDQLPLNTEEPPSSIVHNLQPDEMENKKEILVINKNLYSVSVEVATEANYEPTVGGSLRQLTRSTCKSEKSAIIYMPEKIRRKKQQQSPLETPNFDFGITLSGGSSVSAIKGHPGKDAQIKAAEVLINSDKGAIEVNEASSSEYGKKSRGISHPTVEDHSVGVGGETSTMEESGCPLLENLEEISPSKPEQMQIDVREKEIEFSVRDESSKESMGNEYAPFEESSAQGTDCAPIEESSALIVQSAVEHERDRQFNQLEKSVGEQQQNADESSYLEDGVPVGVDTYAAERTPHSEFLVAELTKDQVVAIFDVSGEGSPRKSIDSSKTSHAANQGISEKLDVQTYTQGEMKSLDRDSKSMRLETDERTTERFDSTKSMSLQIDEEEKITQISVEEKKDISPEEDVRQSLQNSILTVSEDDSGSHSLQSSGAVDAGNSADEEPTESMNISDGVAFRISDPMANPEIVECVQEEPSQNPASSEHGIAEVTANGHGFIPVVSGELTSLSNCNIKDSDGLYPSSDLNQSDRLEANAGVAPVESGYRDTLANSANGVTISSGRDENHAAEGTEEITNASDPCYSSSRSLDSLVVTSSPHRAKSTSVSECANYTFSTCEKHPEYNDGKRIMSAHVCSEHSNTEKDDDSGCRRLSYLQSEQEDKPINLYLASNSLNCNGHSISENLRCELADKARELDLVSGSSHSNEDFLSPNLEEKPREDDINMNNDDSTTGPISEPVDLLPGYNSKSIEEHTNTMQLEYSKKQLPFKHAVPDIVNVAVVSAGDVCIFGESDLKVVDSAKFDDVGQTKECGSASNNSKEGGGPGTLYSDRCTSNNLQKTDDGKDSDRSVGTVEILSVRPDINVGIVVVNYSEKSDCETNRNPVAVTRPTNIDTDNQGDDTSSHVDTPLKEDEFEQGVAEPFNGEKCKTVETPIDETNVTRSTNMEVAHYSNKLQESQTKVPGKGSEHKPCGSLEHHRSSTSETIGDVHTQSRRSLENQQCTIEDISDVHTESRRDHQLQDLVETYTNIANPDVEEDSHHGTEKECISVDNDSHHQGDERSNQGVDVNMIGGNSHVRVKSEEEHGTSDDFFNWNDDTLSQFFATPANSRTPYKDAKFRHEDVAGSAFREGKSHEIGRDDDPLDNFGCVWEDEEVTEDASFSPLSPYFDGDGPLSDKEADQMAEVPDDDASNFQKLSEQQFSNNKKDVSGESPAYSGKSAFQSSKNHRKYGFDSNSRTSRFQTNFFQGSDISNLEKSSSRLSGISSICEGTMEAKKSSTLMADEDQAATFGPHLDQNYAGNCSGGCVGGDGFPRGTSANVQGEYYDSYYNRSFNHNDSCFSDLHEDKLAAGASMRCNGAGCSVEDEGEGNKINSIRTANISNAGLEENKTIVDRSQSYTFPETNSRMSIQPRAPADLSFDEGL